MPFVSGGSLSSILATKYADGMEEALVATVSRDVLVGLAYLHSHGFSHRDLKARLCFHILSHDGSATCFHTIQGAWRMLLLCLLQ